MLDSPTACELQTVESTPQKHPLGLAKLPIALLPDTRKTTVSLSAAAADPGHVTGMSASSRLRAMWAREWERVSLLCYN